MPFVEECVISGCVLLGALFALIGSFGIVKLPDLMTRLHAPTKATTLGLGSLLLASLMYFYQLDGVFSINELLILLFLFLTAPISAHFIGKAHLHSQVDPEIELPPTGRPCGWSTYEQTSVGDDDGRPAGDRGGDYRGELG